MRDMLAMIGRVIPMLQRSSLPSSLRVREMRCLLAIGALFLPALAQAEAGSEQLPLRIEQSGVCENRATEYTWRYLTTVVFPRYKDPRLTVRVRRAGSSRDVQLGRVVDDVGRAVDDKRMPVEVSLIACGVFPDMTFKAALWSIEFEGLGYTIDDKGTIDRPTVRFFLDYNPRFPRSPVSAILKPLSGVMKIRMTRSETGDVEEVKISLPMPDGDVPLPLLFNYAGEQ